MLYDLCAIVEKDRVNVVDKMNVEFWGLVLQVGFGVFFFFHIFEVLDGLCVWVEVWEKELVLVLTFWKDFRFFI